MVNKKAFSLVEIIIAISIIALLAVVGLSTMNSSSEKVDNAKVVSDIETLNNALLSYSQDNGELPMPGGNKNFFKVNTDYAHSYSGSETFGVYGSITENTIAKKYLDILPLDPRTNSYYAYGKTKESNEFEISGVQMIDGEYKAIVSGNYTAENGPYNLIREYNGANFVYNDSTTNLPYNPEELVLIATDAMGNIFREGDNIRSDSSSIYKNDVVLYNTTEDLELFFSDGSVSILERNSEITLNKLNFPKENNLTTFIQIALETGTIWTRATNLNDESEFQIYTTDSTAAVRGTIFGVSYNPSNGTDVVVVEGKVEVIANELDTNGNEIIIAELNTGDSVKTQNQEIKTGETPAIEVNNYENRIKIKFHINSEIRNENEIIGLLEENNNSKEEKQVEIETKNCMFNGEEVEEGESVQVYITNEQSSESLCESNINKETRTCNNGVLSGNNFYTECNVPVPTTIDTVCEQEGGPTNSTYKNISDIITIEAGNVVPNCEWECDENYHIDGNICLADTYNQSCNENGAPENAIYQITEQILPFFESPTNCDWECDTENGYSLSADGDNCELIPVGLNLYATADFNTAGDLVMTKTSGSFPVTPEKGIYVVHSSCSGLSGGNCDNSNFTSRGCDPYVNNKSFCEHSSGKKGIFLNENPGNDFLKYYLSGSDELKHNEDFKIEMNVRVPANDGKTHYLLHSGNFKLFIEGENLKFNNGGDSDYANPNTLSIGEFNQVSIKKELNSIFLQASQGGTWIDTGMSFDEDIENLYVGAFKLSSTSYINQINDIIDYIKIYK